MSGDVGAQVGAQPIPRALVLRLFLAPDDFLRVRKLVELRLEVVVRERILLLEAHDRDVVDLAARGGTRAARSTPCPSRRSRGAPSSASSLSVSPITVWNSPLASSSSDDTASLCRSRLFGLITISGLRYGRSICRRSMWKICAGVDGTQTCMLCSRAKLQEALGTRRRVLGALPFVAVRQQQHESADAAPLHLARSDELVDHDLRAVREVAELRFPDDEPRRVRRRVAVLEAEHRLLGQHRVDDLERRLAVLEVLQRDPRAGIPLLAVLVVQHRMAVRERAAADVLARTGARRSLRRAASRTRASRPCPSRAAACPRPSRGDRR